MFHEYCVKKYSNDINSCVNKHNNHPSINVIKERVEKLDNLNFAFTLCHVMIF